MQGFARHTGVVAPIDRVNIDTDAIIPKQFLKRIERTGFGQYLFYEWRFGEDGKPNMDFTLNQPTYDAASILLARANFGCGSSREHAPWAILDYGFKVIIAPSFADIFYNNCFKNGILPVKFQESDIDKLFTRASGSEIYKLTVDVEKKKINDEYGFEMEFDIEDFNREYILKGLDDISFILMYEDKISAYEIQTGII